MTDKEWIIIAKVAMQAAILTMRRSAVTIGNTEIARQLNIVAEYVDSVHEQAPNGKQQ